MFLKGTKDLICEVPCIDFGRMLFRETEGADCEVLSYDDTRYEDFCEYVSKLIKAGFSETSRHKFGENTFCMLSNGNASLLLSYYPSVLQMRIVAQQGEMQLNHFDDSHDDIASTKLTMIDLEDFGESLVLRLSDGRFIIFDGGWPFPEDADKLMTVLSEQSPFDKPRIAAWIFTHPHVDHYRCFLVFYPKYKDEVVIERFIYNFPEATDDLREKLPNLTTIYTDEIECMRKLEEIISNSGVPVCRAHTGQVFNIGNARIEVISSQDDTCHYPCDPNILSLVFKMIIEGQVILFGSDGLFAKSLLGERYGDYLKSDILQVPHHAFNREEGEVYKLINPDVCLVEAKEDWFYKEICIYLESNKVLMYDLNVKEILTGGCGNVVLDLPYSPRENGKIILFEKIRESQKEIGAKSWFFTDMCIEDCKFSIVNTTNYDIDIYIHLYFENRQNYVSYIKATAKLKSVTKIDFKNNEDINGDALVFNRDSLKKKGIPDGERFTVRFQCKAPVVISGVKKADYIN